MRYLLISVLKECMQSRQKESPLFVDVIPFNNADNFLTAKQCHLSFPSMSFRTELNNTLYEKYRSEKILILKCCKECTEFSYIKTMSQIK